MYGYSAIQDRKKGVVGIATTEGVDLAEELREERECGCAVLYLQCQIKLMRMSKSGTFFVW